MTDKDESTKKRADRVDRKSPVEDRHANYIVQLFDRVKKVITNTMINEIKPAGDFKHELDYYKDRLQSNKIAGELLLEWLDQGVTEIDDALKDDNKIIKSARALIESARASEINDEGQIYVSAEQLQSLSNLLVEIVGDPVLEMNGETDTSLTSLTSLTPH